MIGGIRVKVCGITSLVDAELADRCGADCLGFILHPQSPRRISLEQFRTMAPRLPARRKVAVSVEPTDQDLGAMSDAGFDFFQIHFRLETPEDRLAAWARIVGSKRL
ncbi:MAG: phosphoribosylanthranilate isomerase, partial [Opitutus sp.]